MKLAEIWARIAPRKVIIYADFIDPFCYIGYHNLRRVAEAERIRIDWRGFELNPETPLDGSVLLPIANSDLRPGIWASVRDYAKKSGLNLVEPVHVPNTKLAQIWVRSMPESSLKYALIERIYQAYLSEQKDVGCLEVLRNLAKDMRIPNNSLQTAQSRTDFSILERDRRDAVKRQFPGMPGFIYKQKNFFGALSEEAWNSILKETLCSTK